MANVDIDSGVEVIDGAGTKGAEDVISAPMATSENPQGRLYHFPHILFTKRNPMATHEQRLKKLAEESCEVAMARDADDVISEAWDVIHCAEEILREYPDADVRRVLADHDPKNRQRGYYGDADTETGSLR